MQTDDANHTQTVKLRDCECGVVHLTVGGVTMNLCWNAVEKLSKALNTWVDERQHATQEIQLVRMN